MADGSQGKARMKNARRGGGDGQAPGNNSAQNKMTKDIARQLQLTDAQSGILHKEVTGNNYGYQEIYQIAQSIKMGQW
jgi:hypothetical protein